MLPLLQYILRGIVCCLGVVGNAIIIHVFSKKIHHASTGFVIALAGTDFLTSIKIPVLVALQDKYLYGSHPYIRYGEILCLFSSNTDMILLSISIWLLVAISLERLR